MKYTIVVERHDKKRPHQKQDILLEQELGEVLREKGTDVPKKKDMPNVLVLKKNGKVINGTIKTKLNKKTKEPTSYQVSAKSGVRNFKASSVDCIRKKTYRDMATQEQIDEGWRRADSKSCDCPDCNIPRHVRVVRVLSNSFTVDNKVIKLTSNITLAEMPIGRASVNKGDLLSDKLAEELNLPAGLTEEEATERVLEIVNNRETLTLDVLNRIKRPEEHGYSFEEIMGAMIPYVIKHATKYKTLNFLMDDAIQQGNIGIWNALKTDRAIAPFSSHCYFHIQTSIRRKAMTSGTIRHGEREGDIHGTKGVLLGTDEDGNRIWGKLYSADAKEDGGINVYEYYENKPDVEYNPLNLLLNKEKQEIAAAKLKSILSKANLSEQQFRVIMVRFGMTGYIENPYRENFEDLVEREIEDIAKPTSKQIEEAGDRVRDLADEWDSGWEHTGTETAKLMGCSRQRVGQQRDKSVDKLRDAADDLGIGLDHDRGEWGIALDDEPEDDEPDEE